MTQPAEGFAKRLVALQKAISQVQPIADYAGNLPALYAAVDLVNKIEIVLKDLAPFVDKAAAMAHVSDLLRLVMTLRGATELNMDDMEPDTLLLLEELDALLVKIGRAK